MKKIITAAAVIAVIALAAFLIYDAANPLPSTKEFFAMNTYVTAEVKGEDEDTLTEQIEKIVIGLDNNVLSRTNPDSIVSRINMNSGAELDMQTSGYFHQLDDVCKKSGGAFDYTLGGVSDLWKFGSAPQIPDKNLVERALSYTGYEKIILSEQSITVTEQDAVIDFGASGKGIALDEIKNYFDENTVERAVVSVGGSVLLYGEGEEFTVGIRNPEGNSGDYIATLTLTQNCVSTSGNYEQYFEENGKRYHHILDPETGYPVDNGLTSVTVVSENGLLSDALSTACFVLGIEKGSELAEEYGAKVIFITEDKKIYTDDETAKNLSLESDAYVIV